MKPLSTITTAAIVFLASTLLDRPNNAQIAYHGCGLTGTATSPILQQLNWLKNRSSIPKDKDIKPAITLDSVLATGKDTSRWSPNSAAEIEGFVYDVKPGGVESANCGAQNLNDRDTHIEIVRSLDDSGPTRRFIVEVTPRMRAVAAKQGEDWSTQTLLGIKGHKVKVKGWMMFDFEHGDESENTAPRRSANWRATAWEIHPITSLTVLN
jgi:hypothetical protein